MGVYKTDLKFSTVCEKMSENCRSRGGFYFCFWLTLYIQSVRAGYSLLIYIKLRYL